MNSKVLDESIAESLQTLDLMCFSEQYYFLVALISFGMLLVTICVEIKLLRRVRPESPARRRGGSQIHLEGRGDLDAVRIHSNSTKKPRSWT